MMQDAVWLSLVERAPTSGACALCGSEPVPVETVAVIRHAHGGTVEFSACDRCTRALRRVLAAIGGDGCLVQAATSAVAAPLPPVPPSPMPAVVPRVRAASRPQVLHADVLLEYAEQLVTPDGTSYSARACGGPRADGIWVGWLEFVTAGVAAGESAVRRTGQETTQPNREALAYWASGLEPVYLQGAFARAR